MLSEKTKVNIDKSHELTKLIGRRLREAFASWDAEAIPPSIAGGIAKLRHAEAALAGVAPGTATEAVDGTHRTGANQPRRIKRSNGTSD